MTQTRKPAPQRAPSEWISLPKAAAILGRHRQTVAHMAARGEIGSKAIDERLFVSRADVQRLAREQAKAEKAEKAAGVA